MHVSNYYYIEHRGEVAEKLSGILGGTTDSGEPIEWKTFFSNSGAESNECAIKLARLYAKRFGNGGSTIVTITNSFHGRTLATLAATAQPLKQEAIQAAARRIRRRSAEWRRGARGSIRQSRRMRRHS